jgi:hypothetical protein
MSRESNAWEKLDAISSLLLVFVGAGALIFANSQIRESRDEARMQHLVEVVRQFEESPILDTRRRLASERIDTKLKIVLPLDPNDPPDAMTDMANFYQHIGLLVSDGYLDKRDVWGEFSDAMFVFYADARPMIEDAQKEQPAYFGGFTDLMEDMEKIDKDDNEGKGSHPSQADIYSFYAAEAESQAGMPISKRRIIQRK